MNGHHLYAVVASLVDAHVLYLVQFPVQLFFGAEDGGLDLAYNTGLLIKNDRLNFTGIEHDDTKEEQGE